MNSVTLARANRKEPNPGIRPEDLDEVALAPQVKWIHLVLLRRVALLNMFDRRHVLQKKHVVEPREPRQHNGNRHHQAKHNHKLELDNRELQRAALEQGRNETSEDGRGHIETGNRSCRTRYSCSPTDSGDPFSEHSARSTCNDVR